MSHNLNDAQLQAVTHKDGPMLILAGAGAGKTKTLTHRIVELIKNGVPPHQILAITFTNKAGGEMRERAVSLIEKEIGSVSSLPTLTTFHSFGVRVLREEYERVGLKRMFTIADTADTNTLIKDAIISFGLDPKQYEPKKFRGIISREKGEFVTVDAYREKAESMFGRTVLKIWEAYEAALKRENSVDFDDLLLKTVTLFQQHPDILEKWQERYHYIHIDEYQDTNEVQYTLAKLLSKKYRNLCVVGDGDQTIYSWRGANVNNILNFEKDYPDAKIVLLEENYRSTKNILSVANEIIKKNKNRKDKTLFTNGEEGALVGLYEGYDEKYEAEFVVDKITELLDQGVKGNEIAILYRANFQSRTFEDMFMNRGLHYQIVGTKFFDRKEVKDIISYVRAALNPDSLSDLKRIINVPARGIGKTTILKVFAEQREALPPAMSKKVDGFFALLEDIRIYGETHTTDLLIKYIIEKTGLKKELEAGTDEDRERLANMEELATVATKWNHLPPEEALMAFVEEVALVSDQDSIDEENKSARLMTVHASKGLEFEYVFVVGLEHGLFPLERDGQTKVEEKEEERRLFYVAVTRARKKLFLTYATIRTIFGQRQITVPSEFLFDIPEDLIEKEEWQSNLGRVIYL